MRLSVLGLGKMGHAIAGRLLEGGHELTVWNRTPGKAGDLVQRGAKEAATPAEAASGAEAVFVSLSDETAVRSVITGDTGVAAVLASSAVLVDMSTVGPSTTGEMTEAVGGRLLASPVLGGPAAVSSGEAMYLIGGPEHLLEALTPAYDSLADEDHRRHVSEDGRVATTLKLLSNYLLMSGIAVLAEVVATAQAAGLSGDLIRDYFGSAPLVAPALRNRLDDIVSGDHDGWFSTTLGAKDVRLAEDLARSLGVRLPIAEAVKRRYEEASVEGWAEADIGAVVELIRKHT